VLQKVACFSNLLLDCREIVRALFDEHKYRVQKKKFEMVTHFSIFFMNFIVHV